MNAPSPHSAAPMQSDDEEGLSFLDLVGIVSEHRWLVAGVTAVALALGGVYVTIAPSVYEANTLIQVEDTKGDPLSNLVGRVGEALESRSSVSAEIEILRSRLVVGQAVDNLQLNLNVTPKYLPVIGQWLANRATAPSNPGFLGLKGYVSGNESLRVGYLRVPPALEHRPYSVVLAEQGYELRTPRGDRIATGRVGEPLRFNDGGQAGELLVEKAIGKPGAEFYVARSSRLAVTQGLQRALTITELSRPSGIIRVSLEDADPAWAARVLNEVGTLYVRQNVDRKAAEAEKSLAFLDTQLPQLRRQLEASEDKFSQFRRQKGTFDLGSEAGSMLGQYVGLQTKVLELQQRRKELETRFTAEHPSVAGLDAQLRQLTAEIGSLDKKTKALPDVEQELLRLTRDVKVNSELYNGLLNSFQQLRLVKEGKVGNVRIVDVAFVPESPVKPQRSMMLLISGVLGLLAGLGLAFLRSTMRTGIKDPAEIERQLGLNVFATVPHSRAQEALGADIKARKPGMHLLAKAQPNDASVESLRSLRTALQFAMLDAPNNVVLFTGPSPEIGKSFTTANFAAVLAAGGKRVLLIDGDMRRGHLHSFFGVERGPGLSELIVGTQTLAQATRKELMPQMDLITTGMLPPNPAELLMSPGMAHLMQTVSAQYDVVLIDSPPILAVSDTEALGPLVGTVFMVVREGTNTLDELQESVKRLSLSGVAVRSVIFNDLDGSRHRHGHGDKYDRYRQAMQQ